MSAMFAPIRWRLVAWTMLVVGVILLVLGAAVYLAMSRSMRDQVDRYLAGHADQAAQALPAVLAGERFPRGERARGTFYLIVDGDGRVLANPQRVDVADLSVPAGRVRAYATVSLDGEPVRLYSHPLRPGAPAGADGPGSGKPGPGGPPGARGSMVGPPVPSDAVLIVGQSLAAEEHALQLLVLILAGGGAIGLLLSLAGAWFLAGRALVPIEHAFRRQQEFVADASHELRTPLTVLRSATDLLDRHSDQPLAANQALFDDVRHEIGRLQRLTGDLLTLARSDRGELELAVAPLDLAAQAGHVVRRLTPLAAERGIDLALEQHGAAPSVEADPDRLQQVLLILLDNALKHTPAGGRVGVSVSQRDGWAAVEVADTGPGIAPEHLSRVFERFYRADAARSGEEGGTGLGLAIARTLVDAHGGQLTLTSAPGAGTRATIRLPAMARARSLPARLGDLAARLTHGSQRPPASS